DRRPPAEDGLKGRHEDAQEYCEGGGFRAGRKKGRDWSGRALINVGRPDLEGRGRNLEGQTNENQSGGYRDESRVRSRWGLSRNRLAHSRKINGLGRTVDQRDAVQEECGGKGAQ